MPNSINCVCIDDSNRPNDIPKSKWVEKGKEYNITHIYVMVTQGRIQGCELSEFDISMYHPYNCYRLNRFAFTEEGLQKVLQMMKDCNGLNDLDVQKFVDDIPIKKEKV